MTSATERASQGLEELDKTNVSCHKNGRLAVKSKIEHYLKKRWESKIIHERCNRSVDRLMVTKMQSYGYRWEIWQQKIKVKW